MSSNDMAVHGRYTQRFEREGSSMFIRTFDDATLVHEHECKNTPLVVPNEVHSIAETISAQLALGLVGSETNPITGGSVFSGPNSSLKLPAGATDLSGGLGQKWRYDSATDKVVSPALTISVASTSQIASGVSVPFSNSALTYYHGTVKSYIGIGYQNGTQSGAADQDKPVGVQFYTDATSLEYNVQSFGGASALDVYQDGQPVAATATQYTSAGGEKFVKLVFADNTPKLLQADIDCVFKGLVINPGASVWKAPRGTERTLGILADSWVGGNNSGGIATSWIYRAARQLGYTQVLNFAQPGTGIVNNGGVAARGPYINRLPALIALNPDKIVVCGSVNDCSGPTNLLRPATSALTAALDASGIGYAISGPQYINPSNTASDDVYTAEMVAGLSAIAAQKYFSCKGWLTGVSNAAENRASYALGDNMHLAAAGQRYWQRRELTSLVALGITA